MRIKGISSIVFAAVVGLAGPVWAEEVPIKVDLGQDGIIVGSAQLQEKLRADMVSATGTFESDPMDFDRKLKGGSRHAEAKARALRSARDKVQDMVMQFSDLGLAVNKQFWVGNELTSSVYTTPAADSKERAQIKGYKATVSFRVFVSKDNPMIDEIIGLLTEAGVESELVADPDKIKATQAALEIRAIAAARIDASVRADASGCVRSAYIDGHSVARGSGSSRDRAIGAKSLGSSGDADAVIGIEREIIVSASASSRYRCVTKVTN